MKIKLCKKYSKKNKLLKKLTSSYPEADIRVKSCISMCKHCKSMPTAIVEGKKVKKKVLKNL